MGTWHLSTRLTAGRRPEYQWYSYAKQFQKLTWQPTPIYLMLRDPAVGAWPRPWAHRTKDALIEGAATASETRA